MLKGISPIISPELLGALMAMGHGDEILLADGNFPATTRGPRVVRADGHGIAELLAAILKLFPLDASVKAPVTLMKVPASEPESGREPPVWASYRAAIAASGEKSTGIALEEKPAFIEHASKVALILATGEPALYANVILRKGVVVE
jgi:L-fucose mutarotase